MSVTDSQNLSFITKEWKGGWAMASKQRGYRREVIESFVESSLIETVAKKNSVQM
jgi:hypothetical protein